MWLGDPLKSVCDCWTPRRSGGPHSEGVCGSVDRGFHWDIQSITDIVTCTSMFQIIHSNTSTQQSAVTCLNNYRPVALTPLPAKCIEKLVRKHITSIIPASFDPYQFAYRQNRSTEDAIAILLHSALELLEKKNSYMRMLFITAPPSTRFSPVHSSVNSNSLGLSNSLCNWVLTFLTNRTQAVRLGNYTSTTLSLINRGSTRLCARPLLYTLLTHDCSPSFPSNFIIISSQTIPQSWVDDEQSDCWSMISVCPPPREFCCIFYVQLQIKSIFYSILFYSKMGMRKVVVWPEPP